MPEFNIPDVGDKINAAHLGGGIGVRAGLAYLLGTEENVGAIVIANQGSNFNTPVGPVEIGLELLSYGLLYATNIEEETTNLPAIFTLSQNYPNPFNPSTTIKFTLPKSEFVELKVFNILRKEVVTLVSNKLNQGNHTYQFDGKNLAFGIYYYQLVAGEYRQMSL